MKTVATNKLQKFFQTTHQEGVRSSSYSKSERSCVILEVMGDEDNDPNSILMARVSTGSAEYTLPFRDHQSEVIGIRGNSEVLKNTRAYIAFSDGNLRTGSIFFKNGSSSSVAPVSKSTESFSIGGLLSG